MVGGNEGIIDAVDEYLGDSEEGYYSEGISKLEQCGRKYIKAKVDNGPHFLLLVIPKVLGQRTF